MIDDPVQQMPIPLMEPSVLIDNKSDFAVAQMPAKATAAINARDGVAALR